MQERFKRRSINFGLSQWLIENLSCQQGRVRSDPQKGTKPHLLIGEPHPQEG